jgi:paraquat-inducible protein B
VALRFDARVSKVLGPLQKNITSNTSSQIEASNKVLAERQKAAADAAIGGVKGELDAIKQSIARVNIAVQKVPSRDDLEKLNSRLGQLDRSLARQSDWVTSVAIHGRIMPTPQYVGPEVRVLRSV